MKKWVFLALLAVLLSTASNLYAQHGFGTNTPNPNAVIDMQGSNMGLLIPRVPLASSTDNWGGALDANDVGMTVFNTTDNVGELKPGYYFWNGTTWIRLVDNLTTVPFNLIVSGTNTGQSLTVGDGTTLQPAGTGLIVSNAFRAGDGTTDAVDLNSTEVAGALALANIAHGQANEAMLTNATGDAAVWGLITNANIAPNAEIDVTKLKEGVATGHILRTNGTEVEWSSLADAFADLTFGAGLETFNDTFDGSEAKSIAVKLNGTTLLNPVAGDGLSINLANENTWTGKQTFTDVDIIGNLTFDGTGQAVTGILTNLDPVPADHTTLPTAKAVTDAIAAASSGLASSDFITWSDETATLPNSKILVGGEGLTFTPSSATLDVNVNSTLEIVNDEIGINLANSNIWTGKQTFADVDITGDLTFDGAGQAVSGILTNLNPVPTDHTTLPTAKAVTDAIAAASSTANGEPYIVFDTPTALTNSRLLEGGDGLTLTIAGGSATLDVNVNSTLEIVNDVVGINLANSNIWTGKQTFADVDITGDLTFDGTGQAVTGILTNLDPVPADHTTLPTAKAVTDAIAAASSGLASSDFITWSDETATLPNSKILVGGEGLTFTPSSATLDVNVNSTLEIVNDEIGINLANPNTWTGKQTFTDVDIIGNLTFDGAGQAITGVETTVRATGTAEDTKLPTEKAVRDAINAASSGLAESDFITWSDETATLPNSNMLVGGNGLTLTIAEGSATLDVGNTDGSITINADDISLNTGHENTWSVPQTFQNVDITGSLTFDGSTTAVIDAIETTVRNSPNAQDSKLPTEKAVRDAIDAIAGSSSSGPYIVHTASPGLTDERVLTAGSAINVTDAGTDGGAFTVSVLYDNVTIGLNTDAPAELEVRDKGISYPKLQDASSPGLVLVSNATNQWEESSVVALETDPHVDNENLNVNDVPRWDGTMLSTGKITDNLTVVTIDAQLNQTGAGQVTFSGNVDANNGLDVTGADLTVGGSLFTVDDATGNTAIEGTLYVTGATVLGGASTDATTITGASVTLSNIPLVSDNNILTYNSTSKTVGYRPYTENAIRAVTGSFTFADNDGTVIVSSSGAAVTINLPTGNLYDGRKIIIKKDNSSAAGGFHVTIVGGTIDGTSQYILNLNWQGVTLQYLSGSWWAIARH